MANLYPWQMHPMGKGASSGHDRQMEQNLELFRRILESLAKEPVDLISEPDYLSGMRQCRVHFRHSQFYMMVDTHVMSYGDVPMERLAHDCYERMVKYRRENQRSSVDEAYRSMRDWKPDWKKEPDPRATPEDHHNQTLRMAMQAGIIDNAKLAQTAVLTKAPVGSYDNPLRVELQKRVDAWLK